MGETLLMIFGGKARATIRVNCAEYLKDHLPHGFKYDLLIRRRHFDEIMSFSMYKLS